MIAGLEAAIDDDPVRPRAYAVLADYLQERGDPRGELIAMQLAGERDRRVRGEATAFLRDHAARFAAPFSVDAFFWRFGYIHKAWISRHGRVRHAQLADLLAHPSARFLTKLAIAHAERVSLASTIAIVAAQPRPTLRALELGAVVSDDRGSGNDELGDLGELWQATPRLEKLAVTGAPFGLRAIELPALVELSIASADLHAHAIASITAARWPRLASLSLRGSWTAARPGTVEEVRRLLQLDLPALRRLRLTGRDLFDPGSVGVLVASPLLRHVTELAITGSTLDDEAAAVLVRHAGAFANVRTLDLSSNRFSDDAVAMLGKLAPNVTARTQRTWDRGDDVYDY